MIKNILISCIISLIICRGPYQIENDVLVLNELTFGTALREFKYLLVLFFDPECHFCQQFMPVFEKMASNLKKENFVFAKLDCVKNEKIANHYDIEAFPTLKLLKNDDRILFEGERKEELIEQWLKEKTKPEFKKISTEKELEDFKKNNKVFFRVFLKYNKFNKVYIIRAQ